MDMILLTVVGFGATNAIVFLHVGHWFRRLLCGEEDENFFYFLSHQDYFDNKNSRLKKFRMLFLGRLVHCHSCTGFWVGLSMSYWHTFDVEKSVIGGFWLSATNFIVWLIMRKLGAGEL